MLSGIAKSQLLSPNESYLSCLLIVYVLISSLIVRLYPFNYYDINCVKSGLCLPGMYAVLMKLDDENVYA